MGKPIVATRVGGNPEAVEDGRTGFLIPPGDPDSLVRALLALCEDSDLRKRMGEAGRKRIEEKFVLKDMIRKMERLYLEIHREGRA